MSFDLQVNVRMPGGELESRLLSFLDCAKNETSLRKLASMGTRVDPGLKALLETFPSNLFWSEFRNVEVVEYPPDTQGILYQFEFREVTYHYGNTFVEQLKTWLSAIGCSDLACDLTYNFSQPTQNNILDVVDCYKNGRLAVFVGAGVSRQVGLPLWRDLLNALVEGYATKVGPAPATLINLNKLDLKERARWLKKELGVEFTEFVRQALYRDAYRNGLGSSPIVETLGKMKLLRAVCNYNYDDLLERIPRARFRAVATARDWYGRKHIPVYHVHGLLPFVGSPKGELILSEDDYHSLANTPVHWTNVVQVNLLRECTCLLIGISCTDPNLRRILDLIGREKAGDTYIVQKMNDVDGVDPDSLNAWSTSKEFDRDFFAELGLRTIWIHSYDEIPDILRSCIA